MRKSPIPLAHPDSRLPLFSCLGEKVGALKVRTISTEADTRSLLAQPKKSKGRRGAAPARSTVHLCSFETGRLAVPSVSALRTVELLLLLPPLDLCDPLSCHPAVEKVASSRGRTQSLDFRLSLFNVKTAALEP